MYTELGLRLPSRHLRPVPLLYNSKGVVEPYFCSHPACTNLDLHPSHPLDMLSYDSAPIPIKGHKAPASVPLPPSLQATPTTPSPLTKAQKQHQVDDHHHIWLVTGPAGCGKTTIAEYLANTLNMPYIEGDAVSFRQCKTQLATNTTSLSITLPPTSKRCVPELPSPTLTAGTG